MQVLIIRHAVAEEPDDFDGPDEQRPLTVDGRKEMRRAAAGFARIVKQIDVLASSPLVRAVQTARIVSDEFDHAEPVELQDLSPGVAPGKLIAWLTEREPNQTIALVGHEPALSQFIAYATSGQRQAFVRMGKGAACMIEFEQEIAPGEGTIVWLMQCKQLRKLDCD